MSTWYDIKIGNFHFFENTAQHFFEWSFHKSDRKIITDAEGGSRYIYETTSEIMRKRLEQDGFDRGELEKEFEQAVGIMLAELTEARADWPEATKYLEAFADLTLDDWLARLRKIEQESLATVFPDDGVQYDDPVLQWLLYMHPWHSELAWSFPCMTLDGYAVAILLALHDSVTVKLDCTELIGRKDFQAFDDYIEYCQDETNLFSVFKISTGEIVTLIHTSSENPTLAKFLYAGVITAMETYLSDTLKRKVAHYSGVRRRYVKYVFDDQKINLRDIYEHMDKLDKKINNSIDMTSFHNIQDVSELYEAVLLVDFPAQYILPLSKAVRNRHDIVHRNGRSLGGDSKLYSFKDVEDLVALVLQALKIVDEQIQKTLIMDQ